VSAAEAQAEAQPDVVPSQPEPPRLPGVPFTSESAREARKLRGAKSPAMESDSKIEASLRKAATTDPRAAETLIRWLQRPRLDATTDNSESLSIEELERLHAGLDRLACMEESALEGLVGAIMEGRI
jgi:hypothetical protein